MKRRINTRSPVWPNTRATIKVPDKFSMESKRNLTIQGGIRDIGSSGMFFISDETIPVPAAAEITINFDTASNKPEFQLKAYGKTVRAMPNGVGIMFTSIDLTKLQQCIIAKINGTNSTACTLNN